MSQRQIIITDVDRDRLHDLLTSEFVKVIGPVEYLDDLKAELRRAEDRPPGEGAAKCRHHEFLGRIARPLFP